MQYQFSHALPVEETHKLITIAANFSYSQFGLRLYKAITYGLTITIGLIAGILTISLDFNKFTLAIVAVGFLGVCNYLEKVYGVFLAPIFDKRFSRVEEVTRVIPKWDLYFDDTGLTYENGPSSYQVKWTGVLKVLDHPDSIILYTISGPKFVPTSCFKSKAERDEFLSFLRHSVPEGTAIAAIFN